MYDEGVTLVADPNTDQSQPVTTVPHTRYALTGDGMRLIAAATDPAGGRRSASYTPFSDVVSATTSSGTATFGYDPAVNGGESLTAVTTATGAGSSFAYQNSAPARFQPSAGTDPQGNQSLFSYDGAGNRLGATDATGAQATVTRNPDGTVATSLTPSGATTSYGYDADRQLTSVTPPAGTGLGVRSYGYDGFGRVASYTSGRGVTQTISYDDADRVIRVEFSDATPSVSYSYDAAGQVASRSEASGTTSYGYDPLGRLTSRTHSAGGGTLSYGYDLAGNLTSQTDAGGTTGYGYDVRNLLTSTTTPDGRVIGFGYDPDGRRVDTWFATNPSRSTWVAHTRTDYDPSGRIVRIWTARASDDATRISDLSYSYASPGPAACAGAPAAGADTGLRWAATDRLAGRTTSFCYDAANRLISATTPGADSYGYAYDADGNRTRVTRNATVTQTRSFNAADQLTDPGYGYDAAGNLTASPGGPTLGYTGADQLATADTGSSAGSWTFAGTDQTELISDPAGRGYAYGRIGATGLPLLNSITTGNGTSYLTHDATGSPLALTTYTGQTNFYVLDGLGSPIALINTNGVITATYAYDPYGQATVTNPTGGSAAAINPYRFTGGMIDPTTGWLHLGTRYYDPTTGRFTQPDSLDILTDPTRANRYQYAAANPANYIDPTGHDISTRCAAAGVAGGIIGGIIGGAAGAFAVGAATYGVGVGYGAAAGATFGASVGAQFGVSACEEGLGGALLGLLSGFGSGT